MDAILDFFGFAFIQSQLPRFWDGFQLTLAISAASMIGAVMWGLALVGPRMSGAPAIVVPIMSYIELVRNTPLLLQIYLFYFGLPLLGLPLSAFVYGVIAIASQHGAFLCEIYRAGIRSVRPHSALSSGLPKTACGPGNSPCSTFSLPTSPI